MFIRRAVVPADLTMPQTMPVARAVPVGMFAVCVETSAPSM